MEGRDGEGKCSMETRDGGKCSMETRYGGERFMEEHLTAAAASYYQGQLPPLQHFLPSFLISGSKPSQFIDSFRLRTLYSFIFGLMEDSDSFQNKICFVNSFVKYLGIDVVRKLKYEYYGITGSKLIFLMLMMFSLFSIVRGESLLPILPLLVTSVCLLCMVLSSCTIISNYSSLDEFKIWSTVFKHYSPDLAAEAAEKKFQNGWFFSYFVLFFTFLLFLFVKPLVPILFLKFLLPVFVLLSLLSMSCSIRRVSVWEHFPLCSLLVYRGVPDLIEFMVEYCKDFLPQNVFQQINYFISHKHIWIFLNTINLELGVGTFLQCIWLVTAMFCFLRRGWMCGATLLMTASWASLTIESLSFWDVSSGALYSCLLWSTLFIWPLIWRIVKMSLPLVLLLLLCINCESSLQFTAGILATYITSHYVLMRCFANLHLVFRQVILWNCIIFLLAWSGRERYSRTNITNIKWDSYQNMCVPSHETEANTVLACRGIEGMLVAWQGTVTQVSITSLVNWPEYLLQFLPISEHLKESLVCQIGKEQNNCSRTEADLHQYERCVLLNTLYGKHRLCSLDNWNIYHFGLTISMDTTYWNINKETQKVILSLGDNYKSVVLSLTPGENIEFEGILKRGVGTKSLEVSGSKLKCNNCKDVDSELLNHSFNSFSYHASISSVFNFLLSPTISI